jgi:hypothetical protein
MAFKKTQQFEINHHPIDAVTRILLFGFDINSLASKIVDFYNLPFIRTLRFNNHPKSSVIESRAAEFKTIS